MATRMLQRRGTAAEWAAANEVLGEGAIGLEEDTDILKMGDGVTPWNDLANDRVYIPLATQDARYLARNIINAAGDLLVGSADDTAVRLPRGAVGSRLTIQPDLSLAWVDLPPAANPFTGVDAAGDLLVGSAPDTVARLPVGAEGKVLGVVGGIPAWMTPAAADLSAYLPKAGGAMTGRLTMRNNVGVRLSPTAADVATDPVIYGAANQVQVRVASGAYCSLDAGALYDTGNRVYSASNPPPASGMQLLANSSRSTVAGANVWANAFTFVAPATGRVVIEGGFQNGSGNLLVSLDSGTTQNNLAGNNASTGNRLGSVAYTGLTPGATYTVWTWFTNATLITLAVYG